MAASYPDNVKQWVDKQDHVDDVFANDINGAYHEIIAIEEEVNRHKAERMPHQLTDTDTSKNYKYGLKIVNNYLAFMIEEV